MKRLLTSLILLVAISTVNAQDSTRAITNPPSRVLIQPVFRAEKVAFNTNVPRIIYGDYQVSDYSILSLKTPNNLQLEALLGSTVKLDSTSISGSLIDSISFSIFEIERLRRDDYIYRVFGREIKAPEPDLPENFLVHKTDNALCYGIIEIGDGRLAIPYKGVLLYLTRK